MKNANTYDRQTQSKSTHDMVLLAMFTAIIFLLTFTPIGYVKLPLINATIVHVPVIVGAILLGPKRGAFLGFIFGLTSFISNTWLSSSLMSFCFSPFRPVPGSDSGSPWALVICFVPRILVGVTPWLCYKLFHSISRKSPGGVKNIVSLVVSGVVGSMTNTILVMGLIFAIFRNAYAAAYGYEISSVFTIIIGVVFTNGVVEAVVAAIIASAVTLPLMKILHRGTYALAQTANRAPAQEPDKSLDEAQTTAQDAPTTPDAPAASDPKTEEEL